MADTKTSNAQDADRRTRSGGQGSGRAGSGGGGSPGQDAQGGADRHEATILERIVGLAGAAIVLGILAFMLYQALAGPSSPPDLEVQLLRVVPSGDDYLAEISVRNRGGDTAAQVTVSGRLVPPAGTGAQGESVTTTIDYVPAGSKVRAGLFFDTRPDAGTLQLSADGYVAP